MKRILFIFILSGILSSGCGSNKNKGDKGFSTVYLLEKSYKKYKGAPYRYGGTTSLGFDCSGFVQRVYSEAFHKNLPRTTKAMMKTGKKINQKNLKPGDLVFFHPSRKYYHVGIYIGNDIFIHASSSKGVTKSSLKNNYWQKKYITARRILND